MGFRVILLGIYLLVVISASWVIYCRAGTFFLPKVHYLAARTLQAQHRLIKSDFRTPPNISPGLAIGLPDYQDLLGLYLSAELLEGSPINPAQLSRHPKVAPSPGKLIISIPLIGKEDLLEVLDVDSFVDLCSKSDETCHLNNARVLALVCKDPKGENCSALFEFSQEEAKIVNEKLRGTFAMFLRPRIIKGVIDECNFLDMCCQRPPNSG